MNHYFSGRTAASLFLFLLLLLLSASAFAGCTVHPAIPADNGAALNIVTTIFPPADFARAVAGDLCDAENGVSVVQLLKPGTESHTFDPTPADIITVERCDIFICAGGESDAWVETLLEAADNDGMTVLRLVDLCGCVEEEHTEGMTVHEEAHEDSDEIEYDEHVWTSPRNAMELCRGIADAMCEKDDAHAELYRRNLDRYIAELQALDETFLKTVTDAPLQTVVFGDRFPFRYLCDAYGLSYRAAFPGCAAESEPSAATMAYLIEKIRAEKIPALFTIEMSSGKIASAIAEETGAEILMMHSCHNRTADEAAAGKTYLDLMYENAAALSRALHP